MQIRSQNCAPRCLGQNLLGISMGYSLHRFMTLLGLDYILIIVYSIQPQKSDERDLIKRLRKSLRHSECRLMPHVFFFPSQPPALQFKHTHTSSSDCSIFEWPTLQNRQFISSTFCVLRPQKGYLRIYYEYIGRKP